MVKIIQKKF